MGSWFRNNIPIRTFTISGNGEDGVLSLNDSVCGNHQLSTREIRSPPSSMPNRRDGRAGNFARAGTRAHFAPVQLGFQMAYRNVSREAWRRVSVTNWGTRQKNCKGFGAFLGRLRINAR